MKRFMNKKVAAIGLAAGLVLGHRRRGRRILHHDWLGFRDGYCRKPRYVQCDRRHR